jgi:CheB methylesterase
MLDGDELLQANRPGESDPCLLEPGLKSMEIAVADGFAHTRLSHHHDPLLGGLCRDDVADGVRATTRRHSRGEDPHRPHPISTCSCIAAYGRQVGVIMTGMLSDGSAGFIAVRSGGGLTVVQDPADAANPMGADHCRRLEQIPPSRRGLARGRSRSSVVSPNHPDQFGNKQHSIVRPLLRALRKSTAQRFLVERTSRSPQGLWTARLCRARPDHSPAW